MKGIGVSDGIVAAKVFILKKAEIAYEKNSNITPEKEKTRLDAAIAELIDLTDRLSRRLADTAGQSEAAILDGHILMLQDPEIIGAAHEAIDGGASCEYAAASAFASFAELFESMGDELMSLRASDLKDISRRLLEILTGIKSASIADIADECIVCTHDLTPSDTSMIDRALVKGILTEAGGMTSHTAIIARAMEIPAVLGADNVTMLLKTGDTIIMDGSTGEVTVNPTEIQLRAAGDAIRESIDKRAALAVFKGKPTVTADGRVLSLFANIGGLNDLPLALDNGAEGIGLFRTEFLFLDRVTAPEEDEQFGIYKAVAERMDGKEVIIRTLDIGGDKDAPFLHIGKEDNPFLGFRAVRLCLARLDLFLPQLRAILRASAFGKIKIMIPMISNVSEILRCREIICGVKQELDRQSIAYDKDISVGIMVETPAAAICAPFMAEASAFFSIGTNDLTQYTLAVDRGNKNVAALYSAYNPAVISAIAMTCAAANAAGIPVGMCGEAAGDHGMIPFLIGCGLHEFSMTASSILPARKRISGLSYADCREYAKHALKLRTTDEVYKYLHSLE